MSYRTYINDKQIFGNNAYYIEWIEFIKSQGITIGDDGNYDGYITDVMGALETIEHIVMRKDDEILLENHKDCLYDLSYIRHKINDENYKLTDLLTIVSDCHLMFMPMQFIDACGDSVNRVISRGMGRMFEYKLVDGCKLHVHAG